MADSTSWDPENYAKNARFVADLGEPLLELLGAKSGETILDLGCGDGALTEKLVTRGCNVFGVDSSLAQLRAARQRNLQVAAMDGQCLSIKKRFDAVITNAALHWMKQPDQVIEGVARALKFGGRFIGEFGGMGNVETIRTALHSALRQRSIDPWQVDPWYYPTPEEYAELLERYGFTVEYIELIPRRTQLPGDILAWLETFAQPFSKSVMESAREVFLNEVRAELEPLLKRPDGNWYADYVRLRFKASL
jgi:trans-aconitate methyltransferase